MSSQSSPFTQRVVAAMRTLYPEALADKSFDNTGLLLEAPYDPARRSKQRNAVLLTIDLTKAVADEAIEKNCAVVVAYHPIIFRGLKSITFQDPQQTSLLRLISAGISVYCPHTAVDAVPGGMADWMCDIVSGKRDTPKVEGPTTQGSDGAAVSSSPSTSTHTRTALTPSPQSALDAANSLHQLSSSSSSSNPTYTPSTTGSGRLLTFTTPQRLPPLISRIARGFTLPRPQGFTVALPQTTSITSPSLIHIRTVAVCPGSGSHVFAGVTADLYVTGELGHHEALGIIERGGVVACLGHGNSERGYLRDVMRGELEGKLRDERSRGEGEDGDGEVSVEVSTRDRDPFEIVVMPEEMRADERRREEMRGED